MNFNTDGFNGRTNYIHYLNDLSKLKRNGSSNLDNSFAISFIFNDFGFQFALIEIKSSFFKIESGCSNPKIAFS